ncbi:DMP19 family protein [Terriglobus aquaticus]|uniref:DMP19 family protein n=1 Tax=Terriglobus aquaticus TaxID=940139 RepID=A0ABW9KG49_9BACT|nr:DMP19 family protein [Terriglobus aquaticus]
MAKTKFLDEALDGLYARLNEVGGDPLELPSVLRPPILLMTMQAKIDNGGIRYPMEGDFPFTPPYSVFADAYRAIGANDAADRFDEAVAMFPFEHPEREADKREEFMSSLDDDHRFFQLGNALCGDESIWRLLDEYVKEHAEAFGLRDQKV